MHTCQLISNQKHKSLTIAMFLDVHVLLYCNLIMLMSKLSQWLCGVLGRRLSSDLQPEIQHGYAFGQLTKLPNNTCRFTTSQGCDRCGSSTLSAGGGNMYHQIVLVTVKYLKVVPVYCTLPPQLQLDINIGYLKESSANLSSLAANCLRP